MNWLRYRAQSLPSFSRVFFRDESEGDAGGGGDNTGKDDSGKTPPEKPSGSGAGTDNQDKSGGDKKSEKISFTTEQQAHIDNLIAQRLERDRTAQKKKADDEAAIKAGEFEKLYNAEKQKAEELTTAAETANRLAERTNTLIDSGIKTWPAELAKTDPGKDNVEARLKWFDDFTPVAEKLSKSGKAPDGEHGDRGGGGKNADVVTDFQRKKYAGNLPGQQQ